MSEGKKHDQEKLRMDLIPVAAIEALARVLTHGAEKYGERNWEQGIKYGRVYAALLRHLLAWWKGEDIDPDSGLNHLDHVLANAAFLRHFEAGRPQGFDDRPRVPFEARYPAGSTVHVDSFSYDLKELGIE